MMTNSSRQQQLEVESTEQFLRQSVVEENGQLRADPDIIRRFSEERALTERHVTRFMVNSEVSEF